MNPLDGCVSGLSSAVGLLRSADSNLEATVKDFARLGQILHKRQVFDIVAEPEIFKAQHEFVNAIEPQVKELLHRTETELKRLESKERALATKAELQMGRLTQIDERVKKARSELAKSASLKSETNTNTNATTEQTGSMADQLLLDELSQLKQERDRLKYAKSRQDLQKRQKRMSLAFRKDQIQETDTSNVQNKNYNDDNDK